ncbi:uncharacterized protein LOC116936532 isoform X1 [Daphnia magna]|uniref:uncharacterized protein LOC116936532 isoform X1 n=1 Tax=Daphnia magna TaxID=35525 RepID=UPI0006E06E72|nr:uncharacterized protein LOC116936532 isoform X1 [Daphnia magna]XP_032799594.2 uncharacterized protein LOC116936532 isoform X1 [Daphnia magna]
MKFYLVLLVAVVHVNFVLSYPNGEIVQTRESPKGLLATAQAGSKPANFDSPEFARLVLSCVPEEIWSMMKSCEEETTSKLNTSKPAAVKIGPLRDHSVDGINKSALDKLLYDKDELDKILSDCLLKKTGTVDELTGQLNMGSYLNYFENTTLSSEQKSSAMSSFKSCMTANLISPNLPIFIHWVESADKTEADANSNFVSSSYTLGCDIKSLIQNGCSDASVGESTIAWVLQQIHTGIAKDNHH